MNKRNILSILFILATIAFTLSSCVKGEFDEPPINIPKVDFDTVPRYHKTISELLIKYPGTCDSVKDTIIISGIVTANDESGNLYKYIVIQDETAGLELAIDQASLYTDFRIGQRVYVKCRGMYLGRYNGLPQLGYIYGGKIGRLPAAYMRQHFFLDSLPNKANLPAPLLLTSATHFDITMINKLVRLENVSFVAVGSPWSDAAASGDRLLDGWPATFVVRTSNFASFATDPIPAGNGTIQGILGMFGSTYQLAIRDTADIIGYKVVKTFFSESFASGLGGFTAQNIIGDQQWSYSATYGATISGFAAGASHQNEDWLISPAIDLSAATTSGVLRFSHAINKGNVANIQTNHTVWMTKNYSSGAPSTATWVQLTIPVYPAGTSWTYISSGDVVIPAAFLGQNNVRFAFKYLCSDTESATWEIQNVKITE
jgi:hypothetical protein